jgi:hypothetical protein
LIECQSECPEHSADVCFDFARATARTSNHGGQERPPPRGHPRGRRRHRRGGSLLPALAAGDDGRPHDPRRQFAFECRLSLRRFGRQSSPGDLSTLLSTSGRTASPRDGSPRRSTAGSIQRAARSSARGSSRRSEEGLRMMKTGTERLAGITSGRSRTDSRPLGGRR